MTRFLQPLRLGRQIALRPVVRLPSMTRGYPSRSEMNENKGEAREQEKEKHLKGEDESNQTIDHAPGWNEVLASESEASIKAEREDLSHTTMEELQEKTVKHVKEKHH